VNGYFNKIFKDLKNTQRMEIISYISRAEFKKVLREGFLHPHVSMFSEEELAYLEIHSNKLKRNKTITDSTFIPGIPAEYVGVWESTGLLQAIDESETGEMKISFQYNNEKKLFLRDAYRLSPEHKMRRIPKQSQVNKSIGYSEYDAINLFDIVDRQTYLDSTTQYSSYALRKMLAPEVWVHGSVNVRDINVLAERPQKNLMQRIKEALH